MSIVIYLIAINALTFFLYWWDKKQAIWNAARVPESVLIVAGFAGGSPAGFIAQRMLRHKTRKQSFQFKFWVSVIAQIVLALYYFAPAPSVGI